MWSSGKCTSAIEQSFSRSHWCSAGPIGLWPSPPTAKSEKCLKFARATIFRGPIYGSSPQQFAACNKRLRGSDDYAMVALSTKYLKTYQGGWAGDKGACDKCMCVRMHGADTNYNKGVQRDVVGKHLGLTFAAQARSARGPPGACCPGVHGAAAGGMLPGRRRCRPCALAARP